MTQDPPVVTFVISLVVRLLIGQTLLAVPTSRLWVENMLPGGRFLGFPSLRTGALAGFGYRVAICMLRWVVLGCKSRDSLIIVRPATVQGVSTGSGISFVSDVAPMTRLLFRWTTRGHVVWTLPIMFTTPMLMTCR